MHMLSLAPDVTLHTRVRNDEIDGDNPFDWKIVKTSELFEDKKVLIIGLPGAFTPTCSNSQLPGFESIYPDLLSHGIDEVYCTSVNDAFVMYQWKKQLGVENIEMLPDGNGDFAKGMNMLVDKTNLGFGKRSWRYVALIENCRIKYIWEEDDFMDNCPTDPYDTTTPERVLNDLKQMEV